jgi:hypothetical protein
MKPSMVVRYGVRGFSPNQTQLAKRPNNKGYKARCNKVTNSAQILKAILIGLPAKVCQRYNKEISFRPQKHPLSTSKVINA